MADDSSINSAHQGGSSLPDGHSSDHQTKARDPVHVNISSLKVQGFVSPTTGVANFLNVPYARIPSRFRQAVPIDPLTESGTVDATEYGPCCPQPVDVIHFETSHLYPEMIKPELSAEYLCLNLNIYSPTQSLNAEDKLPVLVWIHGGAFTYGDGGSEYDGNYIVQHSIGIGKPIIFVTMNYRLGYHGFLSSKELKAESRRNGEEGFANLGFHDQRLALQWVQKNIHFFGGNGHEVTCAGESAGAMSVLAHIHSDFPAFQRAFVLSPAFFYLNDETAAQETFDRLVTRAGVLATAPAYQKIDALRNLAPAELEAALEGNSAIATWDEKWFVDNSPSLVEDMQKFPSWLKGIVIGSASEETVLFMPKRNHTAAECVDMVKAGFGGADEAYAEEVFSTYGIDVGSDRGSTDAKDAIIALTTDAMFTSAARKVASAASGGGVPVSLYLFTQPDEFESSRFRNHAYHSLGNSMFFRLPTITAAKAPGGGMRATADAFCASAISFSYGAQPWEPYTRETRSVMVFNRGAQGIIQEPERRWEQLVNTAQKSMAFIMGAAMLFVHLTTEHKAELAGSK